MKTKICSKCFKKKLTSEFYKQMDCNMQVQSECRKCNIDRIKLYSKTKKGLITRIYSNQKKSAKQRSQNAPSYTKLELKVWLYSQELFHELYNNWVISGYKNELIPSCDRINDYKSYTLYNIQLMTWQENRNKSHINLDRKRKNKQCKPVIQFDVDGNFIKKYYSISEAVRKTGINKIGTCCRNKRKTAGNYVWKYKL